MLERGTIVTIEASMATVVTSIAMDESKTEEEAEVCTSGREENGCRWLLVEGPTRVESIGEKKGKEKN